MSTVEAYGCQVNSTACECNIMTWGTRHIYLDVGRELVATGRVARIWKEDNSVLSPSSSTASSSQRVHGERTQNGAIKCGRKWMGPHDWSVLSPTAVHQDGSSLSLLAGPFTGGPLGTGRGALLWRLNTGPSMGGRKWRGAIEQERAEPHGQFTEIDDVITCCYLKREPTWMPSILLACRNNTGFGMAVLNGM